MLFRSEQHEFWAMLLNKGFMSREKFNRLTRREPLTTEDIKGFINRQLVETRQVSKVVAGILRERFGEKTRIVYVKAGHVSDFRYNDGLREDAFTKFYFPKSRLINDFHHAKDAYLNIVVGNVYDTKFADFHKIRVLDDEKRKYNLIKLYDFRVETSKTVAWIPGGSGTIATVRKYMAHNDVMITYETYRQKGGFYDQLLVLKGSGIGKSPIKRQDSRLQNIERYGSFNKVAGSHFALIEYEKKGKRERAFVSIPILMNNESPEELMTYLAREGFSGVQILVPQIKYNGIVEFDGVAYRLTGKNGGSITCKTIYQGIYTEEMERVIYNLEHYLKSERWNDIQRMNLDELFQYLLDKISNGPINQYQTIKNLAVKINDSSDSFQALDLRQKSSTLLKLVALLTGCGESVDLSALQRSDEKSLSKNSGILTIGTTVKMDVKIRVIHQSLTGYYEQIIEV